MSNILEKLKAQASSLLGETSENEETQKLIDDLSKAAEEQAEAKVEEKATNAKTAADAVTAELVKAKEFLAYQSQLNEFVNDAIQFMQQEKERNDRLEKSIPELVDKALNELLSKVRSDKKVPASTNQFSETEQKPEVNIQAIKQKQIDKVKSHNK